MSHFKAISSLEEVIVNVYDESPSYDLRKRIRGCGWTIKVTEQEESDEDGLSRGYDGYEYYDEMWGEESREESWWERR